LPRSSGDSRFQSLARPCVNFLASAASPGTGRAHKLVSRDSCPASWPDNHRSAAARTIVLAAMPLAACIGVFARGAARRLGKDFQPLGGDRFAADFTTHGFGPGLAVIDDRPSAKVFGLALAAFLARRHCLDDLVKLLGRRFAMAMQQPPRAEPARHVGWPANLSPATMAAGELDPKIFLRHEMLLRRTAKQERSDGVSILARRLPGVEGSPRRETCYRSGQRRELDLTLPAAVPICRKQTSQPLPGLSALDRLSCMKSSPFNWPAS
jgi:hypothetical protein